MTEVASGLRRDCASEAFSNAIRFETEVRSKRFAPTIPRIEEEFTTGDEAGNSKGAYANFNYSNSYEKKPGRVQTESEPPLRQGLRDSQQSKGNAAVVACC